MRVGPGHGRGRASAVQAKANSPLDLECGQHVRAYYYYAVSAAEEGSVGDAEGKRVLMKVYEKLF